MSRIIANLGSNRQTQRFADFVYFAIEAAESIKSLAARWHVPEESLRRWRDGNQSPAFDRVLEFRFSDEERVALCRMIAAGRVSVEPLSIDESDRRRQNDLVGTNEHELRGAGIALAHEAQNVVEVIHDSLADGQIDQAEGQRVDEAIDQVQKTAGRLRPGFWQRLRNGFRHPAVHR